MSYTGDGGAVYILTSNIYYLLIERSTFVNCSASVQGGAIFSFYGNNVLHNVCGNNCNANYNDGFDLIDGSSSTSTYTKNYVIQSSVANCVTKYYYCTMNTEELRCLLKEIELYAEIHEFQDLMKTVLIKTKCVPK